MNKEELRKFKAKKSRFLQYVLRFLEIKNYPEEMRLYELKKIIKKDLDTELSPNLGSLSFPIEFIMKVARG